MKTMAICLGTVLCWIVKDKSSLWYRTFRYSLRSGDWRIASAYRMSRMIEKQENANCERT